MKKLFLLLLIGLAGCGPRHVTPATHDSGIVNFPPAKTEADYGNYPPFNITVVSEHTKAGWIYKYNPPLKCGGKDCTVSPEKLGLACMSLMDHFTFLACRSTIQPGSKFFVTARRAGEKWVYEYQPAIKCGDVPCQGPPEDLGLICINVEDDVEAYSCEPKKEP